MSNTTHLQHIGKMIYMMRMQRELTQLELSEKSGVSTPVIRGIENGTANFTIDNLVKVASALECYIDINLTPVSP
jgi:transcriptional regulator with XRE-family HTH domain